MTKNPFATVLFYIQSLQTFIFILFVLLHGLTLASTLPSEIETVSDSSKEISSNKIAESLATLASMVKVREELGQDIKLLNKQIDSAKSDGEKNELKKELDKLQVNLKTIKRNMNSIAASVDISNLETENEKEFSFQKEIFNLLKPAIEEMKEMTSHVRKKSDIREKIEFYQEHLLVIEVALTNIDSLQKQNTDKSLNKVLKATETVWKKKQAFMFSELQAAQLHLQELEASETSITEASQSYIKTFFQKRGLYLTEALILVVVILFLSKISHIIMQRYFPGFRNKHRSFRTRIIELNHRIFTVVLVIFGPMIVFYLAEDWVLFSLGILLIFGIALTLRQTLPLYFHQAQLFLNIGSVREGERILCDGLPWVVERINFFCILTNPIADISQRIPISSLIDLKSRPFRPHEPWFPCKKEDWVILNDGVRGKVIGISIEMVQLVERGGSQKTYQTSDFLANSPRNLSTNFRLKETLGISYSLQKVSTKEVPEILHRYIQQRIVQEGYNEQLLNLRVEFALAGSSSLDLVVIADFKGELGDLYNRLRRAIQRWCVDACSENDWEIPFQQMTLHYDASKP